MSGYEILAISKGYEGKYVNALELRAATMAKMSSEAMAIAEERAGVEPSRLLSMMDNIAVIQVKGMLVNSNSYWNRYAGLVAYSEIREAVTQAIDAEIGAIVFDYDTPGGTVRGMSDTASMISSLSMPTISYTSGVMHSAGYFLGSQGDKVYADTFSDVGSIGVVMKLRNLTKMMKMNGVKVERFRSGDLKQVGSPEFELSTKERKYLNKKVETYAEMFFNIVTDARGIPRSMMEEFDVTSGRTFVSKEALAVSLIDGVKSFDESIIEAYDLARKHLDKQDNNGIGYNH